MGEINLKERDQRDQGQNVTENSVHWPPLERSMQRSFGLVRLTTQYLKPSGRCRRAKLPRFVVPSARHRNVCRKTVDFELSQHVRIVGRGHCKCGLDIVRIGGPLQRKTCGGNIPTSNEIFPALEKNRDLLSIGLAQRTRG